MRDRRRFCGIGSFHRAGVVIGCLPTTIRPFVFMPFVPFVSVVAEVRAVRTGASGSLLRNSLCPSWIPSQFGEKAPEDWRTPQRWRAGEAAPFRAPASWTAPVLWRFVGEPEPPEAHPTHESFFLYQRVRRADERAGERRRFAMVTRFAWTGLPSPRPSPRSCLTGRGRRTRYSLRRFRHELSQGLIVCLNCRFQAEAARLLARGCWRHWRDWKSCRKFPARSNSAAIERDREARQFLPFPAATIPSRTPAGLC